MMGRRDWMSVVAPHPPSTHPHVCAQAPAHTLAISLKSRHIRLRSPRGEGWALRDGGKRELRAKGKPAV